LAPAPSPTPARLNTPTIAVAVGDSITQSTGTGELSKENPKNSWATGTDVNSVAGRLGVATGNRYNLAKNGARMSDMVSELRDGKSGGSGDVAPMPASAGLVLVEFGGNDLCRDTVEDMTSVASYRSQFRAGLAQITSQAPDALIQVESVPDIYNLWYIRGAPQSPTYHPEPESDQAGGANGARFFWTQPFFDFPCQSLLDYPDSYAPSDNIRRGKVRDRDKEYNQVLAEECAAVLRCHFDSNYLFNWSSNRVTAPDGPLLPYDQWRLTDQDISRNEGLGKYLCPVQGVVSGGCGDHFHPSKQGQGKIADAAYASGWNWADKTPPTATATVLGTPQPDGAYIGRTSVHFGGTDAVGLRGQEVRVHRPDGSVTPWAQTIGVAPDQRVSDVGTNYVEVRSLDVSGNRSASTIVPVVIDPAMVPGSVGKPTITGTSKGLVVRWSAPSFDGGADLTGYRLATFAGVPSTAVGSPVPTGSATPGATDPTPPAGTVVTYEVAPVNAVGTGPASPPSEPTLAPFSTVGDFITRQYVDFTGLPPRGTERSDEVAALLAGSDTPAAMVQRLLDNPWFDGAYGPATRLYRAYFLRIPDPSGLDYWATKRRAGKTLDSIAQQFAGGSEFHRRYGKLTDSAFVDTVYQNVFGRKPDASGKAFYLRRLAAGWTRGRVVLQLSESSENVRNTAGLVNIVEQQRGILGRAPTQAQVDARMAAYKANGPAGVFASVVGDPAYRTRIWG
jgi:lysophospholipase L1-like esterase